MAYAGPDCAICLNPLQDDASPRIVFRCNHAFHLKCIQRYVVHRIPNGSVEFPCPLCRCAISVRSTLCGPQYVIAADEPTTYCNWKCKWVSLCVAVIVLPSHITCTVFMIYCAVRACDSLRLTRPFAIPHSIYALCGIFFMVKLMYCWYIWTQWECILK